MGGKKDAKEETRAASKKLRDMCLLLKPREEVKNSGHSISRVIRKQEEILER